jgi:hypothetical protein
MRFLHLGFATGVFLSLTTPFAAADCICLYKGGEVIEGQTACLSTARGQELARCEKSLNVTNWKLLGEPCPTAQSEEPEPVQPRGSTHPA